MKTLSFIAEQEINGCLVKIYESEYYRFSITKDLATNYETSAVRSLIKNEFIPVILVSKLDGVYSVEMSVAGRGSLSIENGKEIIKYMQIAIDTVEDVKECLNIN